MHNPLRSEADAFKWFVTILAGAVVVGVVGAVVGPTAGVVLLVVLIAGGAAIAYRASRGRLGGSVELTRGGDGKHRLLVVANETVAGGALLEEIRSRCGDRDCEVRLVIPVQPSSRTAHLAGDIDEAIEIARQRMELSMIEIKSLGMKAKGEVGEAEPNVALEDALGGFPADEIIISTHPEDRSIWLEKGVVARAREEIDLPIAHVVVDLDAEGSALSS
jgi:GABA permease